MHLQICKTDTQAVIPTRGHPDDAGLDLTAISLVKQLSNQVYLYDTGISVSPEEGYYTQVVARSSTSKMGISLANGTGIIDPSYTGSIKLAIRFHEVLSSPEALIRKRLAQLLVKPLHIAEIQVVDQLTTTARGDGGFGSTGK